MANTESLSKEAILHLARLARLHLTDDEIAKYQDQLAQTIDYVKNLEELDTSNILPTNSVVDLKNVTFEDGEESDQSLTVQEALSNTKKSKEDEFVVERIMQ